MRLSFMRLSLRYIGFGVEVISSCAAAADPWADLWAAAAAHTDPVSIWTCLPHSCEREEEPAL